MGGLLFSTVLFGLWVVLSGKLDAFHLGIGALTAILVARIAHRLIALPPRVGRSLDHPLAGIAWLEFVTFVPWLAWQIAVASGQIARVVFDPRLPIDPRVVRFESNLPHTLSHLVLAHSITLTPGTVTLDLEDDEFVVHALTKEAAAEIEAGYMQRAVRPLFGSDPPEEQS